MKVALPEFRDKLEDCLEARGAQDIALDQASAMVQWAERVHRCGVAYLAQKRDAYSKLDINAVKLQIEKGNASFLDAGGQSLAVAGPQALEKAMLTARESGIGLAVISNVCDLIGVGQLVEQALAEGHACFATYVVDPASEEGTVLTEVYGHIRGIAAVAGSSNSIRTELHGLPSSHGNFMRGNAPTNLGDLVVSTLSEGKSLVPGCTLLCLDLPDLYDDLIKGLEAGVEEAPARLFYPAELSTRSLEVSEDGFEVDEEEWQILAEEEGLLPPPEGTAEV
ncbi:hypothetical protein [Kiloniella laminariae]|uniref:hypothetical protein n=1 Tax=Kiloniella laminariae TaxID=454162 RepID=UPI000374DAD6|nr:hypothetical protein [Kiloniella laminariae]